MLIKCRFCSSYYRPSPGHGALAHWTPSGWVVCLGPPWGKGDTKLKYGKDIDFLEHTRARGTDELFQRVMRARWIGDVVGGEMICFGLSSVKGALGFWNALALYVQRSLAEGPATKRKGSSVRAIDLLSDLTTSESNEIITVDKDGNITIPACVTSIPPATNKCGNGKIIFMSSILGGKQLHYNRIGPHQSFEYIVDVARSGTYALSARVVTPSWKQKLSLSLNGSDELIEINLPFTAGMWAFTNSINLELQSGRNSFRFSRDGDVKGVTIKDFKLDLMDWCLD